MKNITLGLLIIGSITGCATSTRTADTANAEPVQSSGNGNVMRYETQSWNRGVHFCTYTDGLNKVIKQIETFEKCAAEITE